MDRRNDMKEIPQQGWYIAKDKSQPNNDTNVYFNGKPFGGVQRLAIRTDADKAYPVLELEVVPFEGLVVDTEFRLQAPQDGKVLVFKSSMPPEEVLKNLDKPERKEEEPKTEVL
jgi:hypothetical protein